MWKTDEQSDKGYRILSTLLFACMRLFNPFHLSVRPLVYPSVELFFCGCESMPLFKCLLCLVHDCQGSRVSDLRPNLKKKEIMKGILQEVSGSGDESEENECESAQEKNVSILV